MKWLYSNSFFPENLEPEPGAHTNNKYTSNTAIRMHLVPHANYIVAHFWRAFRYLIARTRGIFDKFRGNKYSGDCNRQAYST